MGRAGATVYSHWTSELEVEIGRCAVDLLLMSRLA
jgi:hypothetical protein